ncbi:metallophosphoesterase family protein [Olivibacter sitiensis]|uniref:metallophosphoesterase family protein n=1 Tax=Olivibacter sitiensis TaxID=376470 RepID=UPI00040610FD|nr:metallophosphoesterase family protein [Olivibacter sitiensis]
MTKIGLISDTHGYLAPAVFKHFAACDEIWHAGDFGTLVLAEELAAFKPLKGVYGNIDGQDIRKMYPEDLRFQCEQVDVWMTHIGGYPGKYNMRIRQQIQLNPPKLFICGHSHILKVMYDKKLHCLHLNPGAAGLQGWHKVKTLMRFDIDGAEIKNLEVIELA